MTKEVTSSNRTGFGH